MREEGPDEGIRMDTFVGHMCRHVYRHVYAHVGTLVNRHVYRPVRSNLHCRVLSRDKGPVIVVVYVVLAYVVMAYIVMAYMVMASQ